jgi:MFS family permease
MTEAGLDLVEAHTWFLRRGLPTVLRPGVLARHLWQRSAPAVAVLAVFLANSMAVVALTHKHTITIDGRPSRNEWFILVLLVLVLPVAATVGWRVSRIATLRGRTIAAVASLLVCLVGSIVGGPSPYMVPNLLVTAAVIAVILALTATGIGSILGLALSAMMRNLAQIGGLLARALPVILLTVLVFFNTYVWLMAAYVPRPRMWLALGFLGAIAVAFITTATIERVRPILLSPARPPKVDGALLGTPFHGLPAPDQRVRLSRLERVNVVFVLVISQVLQVLAVSVVTVIVFGVLGLILLTPKLLSEWTRNGAADGVILGMTLPIPQALIQTSMFLGALTFMYIAARAAGDSDYRTQFLDPLIDDLTLTLDARDRYRLRTRPPKDR